MLIVLLSAPLLCQGILLVDYPAIAILSLCFFLWAITTYEPTPKCRGLLVALSVTMVCWSNLGPVPLVLLSAVAYSWLQSRTWTAVLRMIIIDFCGVAVFLGTWYIVGAAYQLPFTTPFAHAIQSTGKHGLATFDELQRMAAWWGMPLLGILLVSIGCALRSAVKWRSWFIGVTGLLLLMQYVVLGDHHYGFPKYQLLAFPFLAVFLTDSIAASIVTSVPGVRSVWGSVCIGVGLAGAALVCHLGDPLLHLGSGAWWLPVWLPARTSLRLLIPPTVVFSAFGLIGHFRRLRTVENVLVAMLLSLVTYGAAVQTIQAHAPYETRYTYGSQGFGESLSLVREHRAANALVGCPWDMGYYLGHDQWFDISQVSPLYGSPQMASLLAQADCVAIPKTLVGHERLLEDVASTHSTPVSVGDWLVFYFASPRSRNSRQADWRGLGALGRNSDQVVARTSRPWGDCVPGPQPPERR